MLLAGLSIYIDPFRLRWSRHVDIPPEITTCAGGVVTPSSVTQRAQRMTWGSRWMLFVNSRAAAFQSVGGTIALTV